MVKLNIAGAVLAAAGKTSLPHFFHYTKPWAPPRASPTSSKIPQPCSLTPIITPLKHIYCHVMTVCSILDLKICVLTDNVKP